LRLVQARCALKLGRTLPKRRDLGAENALEKQLSGRQGIERLWRLPAAARAVLPSWRLRGALHILLLRNLG
jgi:hypothetical protein